MRIVSTGQMFSRPKSNTKLSVKGTAELCVTDSVGAITIHWLMSGDICLLGLGKTPSEQSGHVNREWQLVVGLHYVSKAGGLGGCSSWSSFLQIVVQAVAMTGENPV